MKNTLLTTGLVLALTGAAHAAEVNGSVELDLSKNSGDDYGVIPTLELSFGTAVSETVTATAGITLENNQISGYHLGTMVGSFGLSVGDQDDLFIESYETTTVADPSSADVSLIATMGDASVLLGFADPQNDITDIENIQAAYSLQTPLAYLTTSVDYNKASEDYALGLGVSGISVAAISLGSTLTYADDLFGYEATATYKKATAFLGGDQDDMTQQVGLGYTTNLSGLDITALGNYNIDTEELTPSLTATFNF